MTRPYTQAPNLTGHEIESLLANSVIARVGSHNLDGSIHGNALLQVSRRKAALCQPRREPESRQYPAESRHYGSRGIEGSDEPKGVSIYGRAEIEDATLHRMSLVTATWMPPERVEEWMGSLMDLSPWVMISVVPRSFASWDYGKNEIFAALLQD